MEPHFLCSSDAELSTLTVLRRQNSQATYGIRKHILDETLAVMGIYWVNKDNEGVSKP